MLKTLSMLDGVSGNEDAVREYIRVQIQSCCDSGGHLLIILA